jgi:two-component system, OmpR family, response regulator
VMQGAMAANNAHVLLMDDDPDVCSRLSDYLRRNRLRVTVVDTGQEMLNVIGREAVDLLLLELRLRSEDGLCLARVLREASKVPMVIVSALAEEPDRVMGLELGADDYVTKPFSQRELLARIRAVLRRYDNNVDSRAQDPLRAYRFAGWELNVRLHRLQSPSGERVEISNGEFNLLCALLSSPEMVVTRDQLLERSRLHSTEVYDRAIDVQILRLRRKLEADSSRPQLIRTERGVGYYFTAHVEEVR